MALNVVLVEPEIPQNTGNIARTCVVTGSVLHLVGPLGFSVDEKHIRRAGLDYWQYLEMYQYDSLEEVWAKYPNGTFYYFSTKAGKRFDQTAFDADAFLVFGKETAGLPEALLESNQDSCVRIPMRESLRSLNLSNSVAIAVYEALRQWDFEGLESVGIPRTFCWRK